MVDWRALRELAALFLKLGATAFGGLVAHIAMMEDEVVTRRKWLDRQHFLDLIGATNLIPGPNSTELAIHIGQQRAGWPGLLVAGTCFILPAMLIVMLLAWLYAHYGTLPQSRGIMLGVQPVVVAVIAQALWKFLQTALKGVFTIAITVIAASLVVVGINEVAVIALAALTGIIYGWLQHTKCRTHSNQNVEQEAEEPVIDGAGDTDLHHWSTPKAPVFLALGGTLSSVPLWHLFVVFLKIGSVVYGSGYVLIAFLRADLVDRLHWLTDRQLLDAVAIGQLTPGPVFTTATFIGYQLMGVPGALVATMGIFLPSFLFVGLLSLILDRLRKSVIMRGFLDSVNAASLALMVVVTLQLALQTFTTNRQADIISIVIALLSLLTLLQTRINSAWLIAGGAVAGVLRSLF